MTSDERFSHIRAEYAVPGLDVADLAVDPLEQFQIWFDEAVESGIAEPNTMTVATVSDGRPTARAILLKGIDDGGFVFFTNYSSDKGRQLEAVPYVALTFYWQPLHRQVRVEGKVAKLPAAESEAYFHTRPRGAQLAAVASSQSEPIEDRATLHDRFRETEAAHQGRPVERPEDWGGYLVTPDRIEFWQGQVNRLHDRLVYTAGEGAWTITRLNP